MKIKKLLPMDAESRRLIDWMEKGTIFLFPPLTLWFVFLWSRHDNVFYIEIYVGVYDALQKKYLKTLLFCICEDVEGPMIEEYACEFFYLVTFVFKLDGFDRTYT